MEQVAPWSVSPTILAGVAHKAAPIPSSPATRDGRLCGEHSPRERTTEELISFGGIPDPVASGRRVSNRIQEQPDADDLQLARAKRAAMLRDVEATTGMSFDRSCSIMHFSEHEIIDKANNLGITLGSNEKEVAKSVNDLLDLEAEQASEIIRNLASVKPMNDDDMKNLGMVVLENICNNLLPSEEAEDEEGSETTDTVAPLMMEGTVSCYADPTFPKVDGKKPKRPWKQKIYPTLAVRRSARVKLKKKFHDDL